MPNMAKQKWPWLRHGEIREAALQQTMLQRLEHLAYLWDASWRIPGTSWRIGWDSLIGLIPGIGDVASMAPALYIVWQGYRLGASWTTLLGMLAMVGLDAALGMLPVAGDVADACFKANLINIALLRQHIARLPGNMPMDARGPGTRRPRNGC